MISDERLAELIEKHEDLYNVDTETADALRELQARRKALAEHNRVMSGWCQILPVNVSKLSNE